MKKEIFQQGDYKKISIQHLVKQVNINVITGIDNFIVSNQVDNQEEFVFNFDFPYIVEGILMIICREGKAKIRVNLFDQTIEKSSILLVVPNSLLQPLEQSDDFQVEFLFFTFDFVSNMQLAVELNEIGNKIEAHPLLLLDSITFNEFMMAHQLIVGQYLSPNRYREDSIKGYLYGMIFHIFHFYTGDFYGEKELAISRRDLIYKHFISLLFKYYKKERSVQFYADKLNLTPKYFSKIIKQASRLSALERIDEMVIMGAKALLKSTDLTVAQISEELNFATPSFFGTYFKKKVGMTPAQYRNV